MKYLFFLLVLFNIAFYLWETGVNHPTTPPKQTQSETPTGDERIVLVKELPKTQAVPPAPANPADEAPPPAAPPAQPTEPSAATPPEAAKTLETCYRLGPYDLPKPAKAALRGLKTGQDRIELVKKPLTVETGYLILYPAADTPETAQANRKMLMEKGYKDAWVVDQGENRYAISLAAFKDKSHAEEALARFRAQSIEAELKPRLGSLDKWWLETHDDAGKSALQTLAGKPGADSALVAVKVCE